MIILRTFTTTAAAFALAAAGLTAAPARADGDHLAGILAGAATVAIIAGALGDQRPRGPVYYYAPPPPPPVVYYPPPRPRVVYVQPGPTYIYGDGYGWRHHRHGYGREWDDD